VSRFSSALLIVLAAVLVPALAAGSPMPAGSVSVKPTATSTGSHLKIAASGNDAGFRKGQLPQALSISFQKGFALKPAAVPSTCTEDKALKDACPPDSVLGKGSIQVLLSGARYTANITFFRAAKGVIFYFKEPESGFNGASTGQVKAGQDPYGKVLAFDKLPLPALPPGLDIRLDKLALDVGAFGKAKCTKYQGKGSKRHCAKHGKRPAFVTNPPDCATGSWGIQLRWGYKSGEELREGSAPCATAGQTPPPKR
jgi:hypothetical protein